MKVFVFDTETSGLVQNRSIKLDRQPHVIEFCGLLVDLATGEIEDEIDCLIKPPMVISSEITAITGITNEMLENVPAFGKQAPRIKSAIEGAPTCIAHNLSFDKEMIDIEFERLGQVLNWPNLLCTVEASVHMKGFRLTLTALHEALFNEPFKDAHRARHDVQALVRCCVELYKRGEI